MIGSSAPDSGLRPGAPAETPGSAAAPPSAPRSRTLLLMVAGAGAVVLAAVAAFVLLNNGASDDAGGDSVAGSAPTRAVRTSTPTATAGSTVAAPASPAGGVPVSGRNPFLPPGGNAATTGDTTTTGQDSTTTGQDSTGAATTGSADDKGGSTPTTTVTASPTYVGLYGFSGSTATFWVNDTKYQVREGSKFGGFTYSDKTSSSCAKVTKDGTSTAICVGTVKQLG